MNLQDYFIKHNRKYLDVDGVHESQCVDVIKGYFSEVLGLPIFKGNAINYWTNPPQGFMKIPNSTWAYPKPGDIVIWKANYHPEGYGHIAIANWVRTFDLGVFSQNDPTGSPCAFKTYKYKNIVGWLRPTAPKPQFRFPSPITIAFLSPKIEPHNDFKAQVALYTDGKITPLINDYNASFTGGLNQAEAYKFVKAFNPKEKFVFLWTPGADLYSTYYFPDMDCMITQMPGNEAHPLCFELAHQLQIWYNVNRGESPRVEVEDALSGVTDEMIRRKYQSILPFI